MTPFRQFGLKRTSGFRQFEENRHTALNLAHAAMVSSKCHSQPERRLETSKDRDDGSGATLGAWNPIASSAAKGVLLLPARSALSLQSWRCCSAHVRSRLSPSRSHGGMSSASSG